jgi:hypothetical protein
MSWLAGDVMSRAAWLAGEERGSWQEAPRHMLSTLRVQHEVQQDRGHHNTLCSNCGTTIITSLTPQHLLAIDVMPARQPMAPLSPRHSAM